MISMIKATRFFFFFDVDTSNCKAMISMIKATRFFNPFWLCKGDAVLWSGDWIFKSRRMSEFTILNINHFYKQYIYQISRSQWPRGRRRRSTAARLLRLWVRILPGAWMSVCCECCVLSGRGLRGADYSSRGVLPAVVCDLETSWMRRPWPALDRSATEKNK